MHPPNTTFARRVFLIAGIYGLLVMLSQYLMESRIGSDYPPPITHAEYFYGFIGVTVVWQILFFFLARDPLRYRTIMIPCMLEKLSLVPVFCILSFDGRFPPIMLPFIIIDLALGALFLAAYIKTKEPQTAP